MQLSETDKMALKFNNIVRENWGDRVDNFVIENVIDDPNFRSFEITFEAYNYFNIRMSYDKGRFGWSIYGGKQMIGLKSSQQWFETADLGVFLDEMKDEIESRIPDKFLEKHGWL
ncbi:MAG: hypothetical protein Q4F78_01785 [Bacillota bacterium]|nr:hypothetical protein [Bacillota bacterium]